MVRKWIAAIGCGFFAGGLAAAEPPPPAGIETGETATPPLPPGLESQAQDNAGGDQGRAAGWRGFDVAGFWEARGGLRLQSDPLQKTGTVAETRLHLELERHAGRALLNLTTDFLYDEIADDHAIRLETGHGWLDLREASVAFPAGSRLDVRLGRQVLTWGVGDLLFLNDLFPKDWNAFFIGRDVEYLKAPSDAVRVSAYLPWINADLVYTPRFDADRFIDARRLSFFNPALGRISGRDAAVAPLPRDRWFDDDEWALRLFRTLGSWEVAGYAYHGFWKSPAGADPLTGRPTFPRLEAYGASARGPVARGILSAEWSWYVSPDDRAGDDPLIRNGEWRVLIGYEQELVADLTAGVQYYQERLRDFDAFRRSAPVDVASRDRTRHLATLRLTWLTQNQNLIWSLFAFVSPSDDDVYLQPQLRYKATDHWTVEVGANLFEGRRRSSFFGQFESNSNAYLGVRYGF